MGKIVSFSAIFYLSRSAFPIFGAVGANVVAGFCAEPGRFRTIGGQEISQRCSAPENEMAGI